MLSELAQQTPLPDTKPTTRKAEGEETECFNHAPQDADYYFDDGNIHVLTNKERMFFVHRFKLEEFSELKAKMNSERKNRFIELSDSPEDFRNMLQVIYSCPCTRNTPIFTTSVLVSALRLATKYKFPELREFAIYKLDLAGLSWLDYLPIAREYGIPKWEITALDELTIRAEPITLPEAQVLGMDLVVLLATRRETHHRNGYDEGHQATTLEQHTQQEKEENLKPVVSAKRKARIVNLPAAKRPRHATGEPKFT